MEKREFRGEDASGPDDIYISFREMPGWDGKKKGSVAAGVYEKWEAEIERQVKEMVDYIDSKFNISSLKGIYVCGGTGALYFDHIKKAFSDYANLKYIDLIKGYCDGEDVGALYTVMYGGYCYLATEINGKFLD